MSLINDILNVIKENNINTYLLNEYTSQTEELFYVKENLVMSRNKDITKCEVTIYNDFENAGEKMRGSSSFFADKTMTKDELSNKIVSAYKSAAAVQNKYYELPSASSLENAATNASSVTCSNLSAEAIAKIIFNAANNYSNSSLDTMGIINSLEIFVEEKHNHLINSNNIDVSFSTKTYSGEFICQCKEPEDVEIYQDFKYSSTDANLEQALSKLLENNLKMIADRANAKAASTIKEINDCNNIILEGSSVYELFNYYLERLDASMIYSGYSSYKIGDNIVLDKETTPNTLLSISLIPKVPFSQEGIHLTNNVLIEDNIVKTITGNSRFSYYLNIPTIGNYSSYKLNNGSVSSNNFFNNEPYLKISNFSDFQMNSMTGQFGGEYRLAYYFDGTKEIPITNGSISGNINNILPTLQLSKEVQTTYNFDGPLAISFKK